MYDTHSRDFYWESTGWGIAYKNWSSSEPDDGFNENLPYRSQNCLVLNNTNGYEWSDFGCTDANFRFICEKTGKTKLLKKPKYTTKGGFWVQIDYSATKI